MPDPEPKTKKSTSEKLKEAAKKALDKTSKGIDAALPNYKDIGATYHVPSFGSPTVAKVLDVAHSAVSPQSAAIRAIARMGTAQGMRYGGDFDRAAHPTIASPHYGDNPIQWPTPPPVQYVPVTDPKDVATQRLDASAARRAIEELKKPRSGEDLQAAGKKLAEYPGFKQVQQHLDKKRLAQLPPTIELAEGPEGAIDFSAQRGDHNYQYQPLPPPQTPDSYEYVPLPPPRPPPVGTMYPSEAAATEEETPVRSTASRNVKKRVGSTHSSSGESAKRSRQ